MNDIEGKKKAKN